jgi:hypothetical protein
MDDHTIKVELMIKKSSMHRAEFDLMFPVFEGATGEWLPSVMCSDGVSVTLNRLSSCLFRTMNQPRNRLSVVQMVYQLSK